MFNDDFITAWHNLLFWSNNRFPLEDASKDINMKKYGKKTYSYRVYGAG